MTLMDGLCDELVWADDGTKLRCKKGGADKAEFMCSMFDNTFCRIHANDHQKLTQHRLFPYMPAPEGRPPKGLEKYGGVNG